MKQYKELAEKILNEGVEKQDRTGTGTLSIFGYQMRFNLTEGFPILTTKKVFFRGLKEELLWFLRGSVNVKELQEKNVHIWDEWQKPDGTIGPGYGKQWRFWPKVKEVTALEPHHNSMVHLSGATVEWIDQIKWVIEEIKRNPNSRRLIVSAWNVGELEEMALPPCHSFFQFSVTGNRLSLQLYQRSGDVFLGVPFNISEYCLLLALVAKETGYETGEFIHTLGDTHLYLNHLKQIKEQLTREPRPLPKLILPENKSIFDIEADDIKLEGYDPWPAIKGEVSV